MPKQSSVEWLISQLQRSKDWHRVLNEISQMSSARVDIIEQAKAMHKEEIIKAINEVSQNNVKYANMIIASWSQIEGELFTHNTKLAEEYFTSTFITD
tara:strand:+ start:583 stop:876 length:294 start_codon:yes stop_codon:yes gene_type:complete